MDKISVRFKKLDEKASITRAHATDAGWDLVATSRWFDEYNNVVYGTGVSMEIPRGYVGLVFPRSSNYKKQLALTNCVGVIDSGYRGEILAKFRMERGDVYEKFMYDIGDRIAQIIIMPYPEVEFIETRILSMTDRGAGGYGSSGE